MSNPKIQDLIGLPLSIVRHAASMLNLQFGEIVRENKKQFLLDMDYFYDVYNENLEEIIRVISDIDVSSCAAKIAIDNNYIKPIVEENKKSNIIIKGIRHPIVERINLETEYITNDINLGKEKDGILLFGTNACGKSTFMKAVGLNLI